MNKDKERPSVYFVSNLKPSSSAGAGEFVSDVDNYGISVQPVRRDPIYDSYTNRQNSINPEKKAYDEALRKIKFEEPQYQVVFSEGYPNGVRPMIDFFKYLVFKQGPTSDKPNDVCKSKLRLLVPDTIVFGIDENPFWYYTGKDGFVYRVDNVTTKVIAKQFTYKRQENDLVAVMKRQFQGTAISNESSLMNAKQLRTSIEHQGQGIYIFQKFVKCRGGKACFARLVWTHGKPCYAYHISNRRGFNDENEKDTRKRYLASSDNYLSIFKMSGNAISEIEYTTGNLVRYIQATARPKIRFQEFIVDYIKDEMGRWWFIQVKAFLAFNDSPENMLSGTSGQLDDEQRDYDDDWQKKKREKADYIRLKECKMCMLCYQPEDLIYSLTLKMIYATESHLKRRGVHFEWFDRPEFNSVSDTAMWYQDHKVCKNCFDLYIQEQKLTKVEVKFAKTMGIPINENSNEVASILNTIEGKIHHGNRHYSMRFGLKTFRSLSRQSSTPNKLTMFRFITYINELRGVPDDISDKLMLYMNIFNVDCKMPINLQELHGTRDVVPIGKLRVFYFFAESEEAFRKWILVQENLTVGLWNETGELGNVKLQLNQFASGLVEKLDYFQLFSSPVLRLCSLRATLGFEKGREMEIEGIKLEPWTEGVYVPQSDFFTADPLPDEWMKLIPRLGLHIPLEHVHLADMNSSSHPTPTPMSGKSTTITVPSFYGSRPSSARSGRSSARSTTSASRPASASRALQRRAHSATRRSSSDTPLKERPYPSGSASPAPASLTRGRSPSTDRRRPMSAMESRRRPTSDYRASPQHQPTEDKQQSHQQQQQQKMHQTPTANTSTEVDTDANTEITVEVETSDVWLLTLKYGSVNDLDAGVDESWVMNCDILGFQTHHESFQLMSKGPMIFDAEDEVHLVGTKQSLRHYLSKQRFIKIIIYPKYNAQPDDERVCFINMKKLNKSSSMNTLFPLERKRADEVDVEKYYESDSDGVSESQASTDNQDIAYLQASVTLKYIGSTKDFPSFMHSSPSTSSELQPRVFHLPQPET